MKIYVCIKQVPDTETKLKLRADGSGVDDSSVKWVMNPYDEFAVEEALKLREAAGTGGVVAISVGPKKRVADVLRTALAMGADEAIMIDASDTMDSMGVAKALAGAIKKEGAFDLVFSGKLAIDDNASSVSQQLAELLGIPHATVVSKFSHSAGKSIIEREVEGGTRETYELKGPAVIAANKGLNTPRYASLPGIMKAKKKPLKEFVASDLGVSDSTVLVRYSDFRLPAEKSAVKILNGDLDSQVNELVRLLREEAKVI